MKRIITILLLLFVLSPAAMQADARSQQPHKSPRDLYQRYASRTDLTVAQIDGFKLNDSVKVDVIILVADNDKSWQNLRKEFDIRNDQGVATWTGSAEAPEKRVKWNGSACCKVIASPSRKTVCLYLLQNKEQYESLMDYQMNLMMNK